MRSRTLVLAAAAFLLLPACGGGSSGSKPPAATWAISGTITGDAIENIVLTLSGDGTGTTGSNQFGEFAFPFVTDGTYSITPYADGVTFVPPNRIVLVSGADVTGVDFTSSGTPPALDATPPVSPVRLVFVHHLTGTNWLSTANGGLGDALGTNNYYVRDVSFGWIAPQNVGIGSHTDIGQWYSWFADTTVQGNAKAMRDNITGALYAENGQYAPYTAITDPGGPNEIVLILSSYVNSAVKNDDVTQPAANLYGQPASSPAHTLSNCKEVYRQILAFFKTQPDKLFVVLTAPPLVSSETFLSDAANARSLNNWLVNSWLLEGGWENRNVAVFDFFNVLTNADNHHRVVGNTIEHVTSNGDNFSDYGMGTSEVNTAGLIKGRDELVPILNVAYNRWQAWHSP